MQKILAMNLAFLFALCLGVGASGCAKKTMSERDVRREQLRINAYNKRQELAPLAGDYRGHMKDATDYKQDISLHLELKDLPETEGGQVDPVLLPTVSGALSLTYGSGNEVELYNFGTTKADFDSAGSKLDLVVSNSQFKDISLTMHLIGGKLVGTWSATSTSSSGEVELVRAASLNLGGEIPQVRGLYQGIMTWQKESYFAHSVLTVITGQDEVDSFHISANLRMLIPSQSGDEFFLYEFDTVEFNPLSRQITLKSDKSEIYCVGQLLSGGITGNWYSKRIGLLGTFSFSQKDLPDPVGTQLSPGASGSWYASVKNLKPGTQLAERLMLSFNAVPDKNQPGGLALAGSTRFYYGSYTSNEYLEQQFETVDYVPFARKLVAVTGGTPKLTIQFDVAIGSASGRIVDASLGEVATFTATRSPPPDSGISLSGEYSGVFIWNELGAFQVGRLNLVPSFDVTGLKISAASQIFYGDFASREALSFHYDTTEFNSVTSLITLSDPSSDIVIKGYLNAGVIKGEWFSTALGRLGEISLSKTTTPKAPDGLVQLEPIKGTYRGTLRNTSTSTNLPERLMFGLITTPNPSSAHGLSVTGNMRLYYGSFDSTEFVELPFEAVTFDPFRRTISGKTSGKLRLTMQGSLSVSNIITGILSDDSLGKIGEFEVEKYVP